MNLDEIRQIIRMAPIEPDRVRRRLSHCHSIDDLRAAARRVLPRSVFGYVDGAADEEVSLAANRAAFRRYRFTAPDAPGSRHGQPGHPGAGHRPQLAHRPGPHRLHRHRQSGGRGGGGAGGGPARRALRAVHGRHDHHRGLRGRAPARAPRAVVPALHHARPRPDLVDGRARGGRRPAGAGGHPGHRRARQAAAGCPQRVHDPAHADPHHAGRHRRPLPLLDARWSPTRPPASSTSPPRWRASRPRWPTCPNCSIPT